MSHFNFKTLLQHLESSEPKVVMWATHQLIEHWKDRADEFVEILLHSKLDGVRQAGILLAGKSLLSEHTFRIFGWFSRSEGELKEVCATALANMKHSPTRELFWKEALHRLNSEDVNFEELRTTLEHILSYEDEKDWWRMERLLPELYGDHMRSLLIFDLLSISVSSSEQVFNLVTHYGLYREYFSDPQFSQCLINIVYREGLTKFLEKRLPNDISFTDLYSEIFENLSLKNTTAIKRILLRADTQFHSEITLADYATVQILLLEQLELQTDTEQEKEVESLEMMLLKKLLLFEEPACIHRMQELEESLVFWLPLSYVLRCKEEQLLQKPLENAEQIAKLYFSDIPHTEFIFDLMECLNTLSSEKRQAFFETALVQIYTPAPLSFPTAQDAVWNLVEGRNFVANFPFPNLLPEPWHYGLPEVVSALLRHYKQYFSVLLKHQYQDQIDYALDLFRREIDEEILSLVLNHFSALINSHFTPCFEFIELSADVRFIPKLEAHYHEGEDFIAQLLELLYKLHNEEPRLDLKSQVIELSETFSAQVRIQCPQCQVAYHYQIQELYYDEDCIQERHPFHNHDLWNPETLQCKNCQLPLPFHTDSKFRSNLYTETLTSSLMTLSEEEQKRMSLFKGIQFPVFFGEKKNPGEFFDAAQQYLESGKASQEEQMELLLESGRLKLALSNVDAALELFQQCLKLKHHLEALFHLGGIAFLKKNVYEARLYFSRLLETSNPEKCSEEEKNMRELSKQYLEILEHREFRRSSLTLIQ